MSWRRRRPHEIDPAERAAGVVAASAGNHAQGVALAASMLGIRSTIFMPRSASMPKVIATRDYGADVRFHGATLDEAIVEARAFAESTGAIFISPFDHADIVAGQGTYEDLDTIFDLAENMTGKTICVLSDSCAAPVISGRSRNCAKTCTGAVKTGTAEASARVCGGS